MMKLLAGPLLALSVAMGMTAVPTKAKADTYVQYHYEYRWVWVRVAYTAYDYYGHPYTAYKWVKVKKLVKLYY